MSLWKMELKHVFRSWRGWLLLLGYVSASPLAIIAGIFIDRSYDFAYDQVIDFYVLFTLPAGLMFIGIVVSSLSFDSNKNLSIFLRLRFSVRQILVTKLVFYFLLSSVFFLAGLAISFIVGGVIFDSSDTISFTWMLWGLLCYFVGGVFWAGLMSFTSGMFMGAVASVLFTLAVIIGFPVVSGVLMTVEMLMRGLMETAPNEWENVSYIGRVMQWWPANIGDTTAFFAITDSEIAADRVSIQFQETDLDPFFRMKSFITALVSTPILFLFAWRKYSRREV